MTAVVVVVLLVGAMLEQGHQYCLATQPALWESANLELVFVERHRQRCVSIDFVHKLATGNVLKDDAAGVLAQSERQEGAL